MCELLRNFSSTYEVEGGIIGMLILVGMCYLHFRRHKNDYTN